MTEFLPPQGDAYTESWEPFPDEPLEAYIKLFNEISYVDERIAHLPEGVLLQDALTQDVPQAEQTS